MHLHLNLIPTSRTSPTTNHRSKLGGNMTQTAQGLMNAILRDPARWWIKVVPLDNINGDGKWVDCDYHQFSKSTSFKVQSFRLSKFIPEKHVIVKVRSAHEPPI
jgi:hypothetical protein